MRNNERHIVATCVWDTQFDDKHKAVDLQNSLSHWSQYHLQEALIAVFNEVCPEEQTLKIKKLELHLGEVNYDNLKEDLSEKIKKELYKKLQQILLYPTRYQQEVEILHEKTSQIKVLEYFLLRGTLPWDYQTAYGALNQLLETQWQNNKQELIAMLWSVGTHENARRRIAWQLTEKNIVTIVENIASNNQEYVQNIAKELVKIQEKENVVQIGLHDFKRNVWFWILNYMFVERGTMFNKVAFVKSMIRQMANHFNMEYSELLEIIEEAVNNVKNQYFIKNEFITIINELSKEQLTGTVTTHSTDKQLEYYWEFLFNQLNNSELRSTSVQKKELNELLLSLKKQDEQRFKRILKPLLNKNETFWKGILKDITPEVIEALISALNASTSSLRNQIRFLNALQLPVELKTTAQQLWGIGFLYAKKVLVSSSNQQPFLNYLVTQLSKTTQKDKEEVITSILSAEIQSRAKLIHHLPLYTDLKEAYLQALIKSDYKLKGEHIEEVVQQLHRLFETTSTDVALIEKLQEIMLYWMVTRPTSSLVVLKKYQEDEKFRKTIKNILADETIAYQVLKILDAKAAKILDVLEGILDDLLINETQRIGVFQDIRKHVTSIVVKITVKRTTTTTYEFLQKFIEELKLQSHIHSSEDFKICVLKIVTHKKWKLLRLTSQQKRALEQKVMNFTSRNMLGFLVASIKNNEYTPQEIAKALATIIHAKQYEHVEFKKQETTFITYLIPKAHASLKTYWVQVYTNQLRKTGYKESTQKIQQVLEGLFWQCLVNYAHYKGSETRFIRMLQEAVEQNYKKIQASENYGKKRQRVSEDHENSITKNTSSWEFFNSVLHELEQPKAGELLKFKNKTKTLENALLWSLEMVPYPIKNKLINRKTMHQLKKHISFEQLLSLLIADTSLKETQREFYKGLLVLFTIATTIQQSTKFKEFFWNTFVDRYHTSESESALKTITLKTFSELQKENEFNSEILLRIVKDKKVLVPKMLLNILKEQHTRFVQLAQPDKEVVSELLRHFQADKLEKVAIHVLKYQEIPHWLHYQKTVTIRQLINEIAVFHPLLFLKTLRSEYISKIQFTALSKELNFNLVIQKLQQLYPVRRKQLGVITKLHQVLSSVKIKGVPTYQVQSIIEVLVLKAWINVQWKLIDSITIWNELLWELSTRRRLAAKDFFSAFDKLKEQLPIPLQLTYEGMSRAAPPEERKIETKQETKKINSKTNIKQTNMSKTQVMVRNAGMVLLNSYFSMLLERLNLVKNNDFVSEEAQQKAALYLQYVVTGLESTEEQLLPLNKVLCGIPVETPIAVSIEISNSEKELINGLLNSCIDYWSAIGSSTVDGFRGNWLVREGLLKEEEERWQLTVEKRPYDVLMLKSPFFFSIIKLPWMSKPLHVSWPF
ncbi:contractile injection system tape measure protein [Tenacibaculum tangerinum]|uniref:Contractile injection system tape measure protein n=1 Tax=Tenacibaculum tangerinum TaxID=3038772 RepID=A0ABY8L365_9FLAO|nr:contractile injection system tape measure protein [Tenacibaculum tangerinum]WGH75709.1 contractile injection system tape measure protein [Tenacibaculum tangerinum]